jgi:hypothetical protein
MREKRYRQNLTPGRCDVPRSRERPEERDLYWIAGFLEGEACFRASNTHCEVTVHQCNREPLEKLQRWLGGRITDGAKRYEDNPNWTKQWRWGISGARARGVLLTIFPLLSAKHQANIVAGRQTWRLHAAFIQER